MRALRIFVVGMCTFGFEVLTFNCYLALFVFYLFSVIMRMVAGFFIRSVIWADVDWIVVVDGFWLALPSLFFIHPF